MERVSIEPTISSPVLSRPSATSFPTIEHNLKALTPFPSLSPLKIIFVHGCFRHQHPSPDCKRAHKPRSNLDYWRPKLEKNKARDVEHFKALKESGWDVLVLWECEVAAESDLADRIRGFLDR